ncbi:hypothetical protein GPALN_010282 [Globodera pallida]|nr:hypothetical protein GPALN_010282 [Globodera pallida]
MTSSNNAVGISSATVLPHRPPMPFGVGCEPIRTWPEGSEPELGKTEAIAARDVRRKTEMQPRPLAKKRRVKALSKHSPHPKRSVFVRPPLKLPKSVVRNDRPSLQ